MEGRPWWVVAAVVAVLAAIATLVWSGPAVGSTSHWGIVITPCAWCGGTNDLEVHHIVPQHVAPDLARDTNNMVVLCRKGGRGCHYYIGHHGKGWAFVFTNVMDVIRAGEGERDGGQAGTVPALQGERSDGEAGWWDRVWGWVTGTRGAAGSPGRRARPTIGGEYEHAVADQ